MLRKDGSKDNILLNHSTENTNKQESLISSGFNVKLADGTEGELVFKWPANPGQFAPLPEEEALLRVVADWVQERVI